MFTSRVRAAAVVTLVSVLLAIPGTAQDTTPVATVKYQAAIRVACVGDSITQGHGVPGGMAWPDQLARMLGAKWKVENFGVSGTTLMKSGDNPYQKQQAFANAKSFNPDVVVIMLGTNDTKPGNWKDKARFEADYRDLLMQFAKLPGKPKTYVCYPPRVVADGNWGINEAGVQEEIPIIAKLAKTEHIGVIDIHAAFKDKDALIPDKVHPNSAGAALIARTVYAALTGREAPPDTAK